jgi:pyruvate dehydrogenase E2 component (dihydrolipoamide acetyltransferase)
MIEFRMPSLGADMEAGTLVEWLVKPGDTVKRGDVVAVVETQKGAIEIEIFNAGVMSELVVPVGQRVPVGTLLARVDGAMTAVAAAPAHPVVVPAPVTPTVPATPLPPVAPGRQPVSRRSAASIFSNSREPAQVARSRSRTWKQPNKRRRPRRQPAAGRASIRRRCARPSPRR